MKVEVYVTYFNVTHAIMEENLDRYVLYTISKNPYLIVFLVFFSVKVGI